MSGKIIAAGKEAVSEKLKTDGSQQALNSTLVFSQASIFKKGLFDIHRSDNKPVKNKSMSVSVGYMLDWKKAFLL